MVKLIRFFCGTVVFYCNSSFPERFLNLATSMGIKIFNIRRKSGNTIVATTFANEYKSLKTVAKKTYSRIKIKKKSGLPFIIKKYRKRKSLLVGIALFFGILYCFSLFVWSVKVYGNTTLLKSDLENALYELGAMPCVLKSKINVVELETEMMNRFKKLSWLSIIVEGNKVTCHVKEKTPPPNLSTETFPCNIVASCEGQITRMEVYRGEKEISVGDSVTKGQLLVNGLLTDQYGKSSTHHSDAKIFAATKKVFKEEVPFNSVSEVYTGKKVCRKKLKIFNLHVPLTFSGVPSSNYKREIKIDNFSIFKKPLPISYYKETWYQYKKVGKTLSETEALEIAHDLLDTKVRFILKDVNLLNVEYEEKKFREKCVVIATYHCEENIVKQVPIEVTSYFEES